ncbi:unnamed protein product [Mytilus coruscus]|uniref:Uncharacterized protein n=1 Tax=Mytilus coruscus TaxID=42192 RepID=A0A6J8E7P7_MYTCO|nr:unnamed protein product [Mytilus coruscus]
MAEVTTTTENNIEGYILRKSREVFKLGDCASQYQITVNDYSGTAGDGLQRQSSGKFSAIDRDNSGVYDHTISNGPWCLRGQASLCQYKATCKEIGCNHIFDYSDEIIKDNLVRGIADPEIMSDLLGDSKTDRTLEETVSFIAQKEQGKVTRSAVGDSASPMSATCNNQKKTPSSWIQMLGM